MWETISAAIALLTALAKMTWDKKHLRDDLKALLDDPNANLLAKELVDALKKRLNLK